MLETRHNSLHGRSATAGSRRPRASAHRRVLCLFLLAIACVAQAADWRLTGIGRVVAISDVHGAYDGMVHTLESAAVIDDQLHWAGGDTHLVIVGDLLDRGADSRKVMDLVMALEKEAPAAGGAVHLLLGNHEVMNLVGDLRYTSRGEFAAFAAEESPEERAAWFDRYRAAHADVTDEDTLQADFDRKAPPGFFGHRRAFRPDGYYGKWLLQHPLLMIIDGTAYVHGGLSPMIADMGLSGVNDRLRDELTAYTKAVAALNDAGLLSPIENFYDNPDVLAPLKDDPTLDAAAHENIGTVIKLNDSDIHSPEGPLWYRGNVGCSTLIESDRLEATLAAIGANRVVIGHTPTVTRRILERFDGHVIEIDTGMLKSAYHGSGHALIVEGGTLAVVDESGERTDGPVPHPRRVGLRAESLTADDLERILAHGEVASSTVDESGRKVVHVVSGNDQLDALFTKNPRGRGFVPELAAYRLDRMLHLDMVPVTVAREVDGDRGTLQFRPTHTIDEAKRAATGQGAGAWCPLPDQWAAVYIFDALIFNPGRPPQNMVYSTDNWQLMLIGQGDSFSTRRGRPPWLKDVELKPGKAWIAALEALDTDTMTQQLGDVLDKKRIGALLARRDEIVASATATAAAQ